MIAEDFPCCREEVVCVRRACSSSILALYLCVGRNICCRECGSARLFLPFILLSMIGCSVAFDGLSGITPFWLWLDCIAGGLR
jgi:hypothetical protein